ncbi:MAG: hypothetical protein GXN96_04935 [Aquificae bacterium]|nr:hypothetical protein [Aquificota bacterium]
MIDPDILLIAFVDTIEGVKNLIGERGAGAVLREAGRHSGPKLLESLIGRLPETLSLEEALRRTSSILEELGFAERVEVQNGTIRVVNDIFTEAVREEVSLSSPVVFIVAGLIEGFVQFMSGKKINLRVSAARKGLIEFSLS